MATEHLAFVEPGQNLSVQTDIVILQAVTAAILTDSVFLLHQTRLLKR